MNSRYQVLFFVLLVTLMLVPLCLALGLPRWLFRIPVAACLVAAVLPQATRRARTAIVAALLAVVAAANIALLFDTRIGNGLGIACLGIVGLVAAASSFQFTVSAQRVDRETIYAALSTYLLAGIFFGQLYWALERIWPGSIVGPDPVTEDVALYYSFVTLATLGYGDYLPRSGISRGLATFEVIGGQLYLAVMVARLIGLYAPSKSSGK